MKISVLDK